MKYLKKISAIILFSAALFLAIGNHPVLAQNKKIRSWVTRQHRQVCSTTSAKNTVQCHAHIVTDDKGSPDVTTSPSGYGPAQFHAAYNLPATAASKQILAIVDAYDDPNALTDLNTFSQTFGIPTINSCAVSTGTTSLPCFQKVNQNGQTSYPAVNSGWALETSLDVQIAHAICQNCSILLVEANSSKFSDLLAAVDRARIIGATVISNSYGGSEFSGETAYDSHFNYPGIAFTFSSGDSGYGTQYPAASQYVTAVGGTTLTVNTDNSYNNELVWSGSGSGCSSYETKPGFQTDTGCSRRTIADVSADADPSTGAAIYDSVGYSGSKGWFQVGGTSLASPLVAATYALAGFSGAKGNSVPYAQVSWPANIRDVTGGSNGHCSPAYLCTGLTGYDGPSGLGTPNGILAFTGGGTIPPTPTPSVFPTGIMTPTPTPTPPGISTPTPTAMPTGTTTPTPTPIRTPTPTVTTAPSPISVTIVYPKNGSSVSRGSTVTIMTNVSKNVTGVTFTVNNSLVCSINRAPFFCSWNVPRNIITQYTLTATARNAAGNSAANSVQVTSR